MSYDDIARNHHLTLREPKPAKPTPTVEYETVTVTDPDGSARYVITRPKRATK